MKNPPSRFFVAVNTPSSGSAGALARICGGRGRPRSASMAGEDARVPHLWRARTPAFPLAQSARASLAYP